MTIFPFISVIASFASLGEEDVIDSNFLLMSFGSSISSLMLLKKNLFLQNKYVRNFFFCFFFSFSLFLFFSSFFVFSFLLFFLICYVQHAQKFTRPCSRITPKLQILGINMKDAIVVYCDEIITSISHIFVNDFGTLPIRGKLSMQ